MDVRNKSIYFYKKIEIKYIYVNLYNKIIKMSIKLKRISHESKMLEKDPLNIATAYPSENGMSIWYALFMGPYDSVYKGGQYICKIILSDNYPFTPPDFIFLTPSGRFEINKKICLTITGFHSDMWQSTITIKTMLIQIFSVFYQDVDSGIAHLIPPASGTTPVERKKLAENSIKYNLQHYKEIYENFNFKYLNDGSPEAIKISDNINEKLTNTIEIDKNKKDILINNEKVEKKEDDIVKKDIVTDNIATDNIATANIATEDIIKKKVVIKKTKNLNNK